MPKPNIMYMGPYRQNTVMGQLSRDYLYSLATCNINLDTRPIYNFNEPIYNSENDSQLQQVLDSSTSCKKYDGLIQVVPHFMSMYDNRFGKNYGIYQIDNMDIKWTNIQYRAQLLDEIWVGTKLENKSLLPIQSQIIGIPINTEIYNTDITPFNFNTSNNTFKFYFIGSFNLYNNIQTLVLAFLLEFHYSDNVSLTILTDNNKIIENIITIKNILRKHMNISMYKEITTMVGELSLKEKCAMHKGGNCFVAPVHNKPYTQEVLYAGLFKSTVITTDELFDNITDKNALIIKGDFGPVVIPDNKVADTNTAHEKWKEPNILSLRKLMRQALKNEKETKTVKMTEKLHNDIITNHSYKQIGENILCLIQ